MHTHTHKKMDNSCGNVLLQGTVSVQYGLVTDRISLQAAWEGVRLLSFPWGRQLYFSNPTLTFLMCALQHTADTEFTDKVANFHPYCPVTVNEKWPVSDAGMHSCSGEACTNIVAVYITCRCCLARPWLRVIGSLGLLFCIKYHCTSEGQVQARREKKQPCMDENFHSFKKRMQTRSHSQCPDKVSYTLNYPQRSWRTEHFCFILNSVSHSFNSTSPYPAEVALKTCVHMLCIAYSHRILFIHYYRFMCGKKA